LANKTRTPLNGSRTIKRSKRSNRSNGSKIMTLNGMEGNRWGYLEVVYKLAEGALERTLSVEQATKGALAASDKPTL
jgi:hypothetical protein